MFAAALENPRLTEGGVVRTLGAERLTPEVVEAIAGHPRWSHRYEVRLALIRHPATSLRRMLGLLEAVRREDLADLEADRRMPVERRRYLARLLRSHKARGTRLPGLRKESHRV